MKEFFKNYDLLLRLKYIAYLLSILTLMSFLARYWLYFELMNCFRVYYFYCLLLLSMPFFIKKKWALASSFLIFSLLNASQFLSAYISPAQKEISRTEKAFVLNVFTANKNHQAVLDLIKAEDPEHIVLTEVNERWFTEIHNALVKDYPYILEHPRSDNFGIMFLSKKKFVGEKIFANGLPVIKAKFSTFTLLAVHPLPPINKKYFTERNNFLGNIKNWIKDEKNILICGDFNTVPWSPFFKDVLNESKLRNCSKGYGINTSWPTNIPFLRIPIDHCLISESGSVKNFFRGPIVGSDHFPIITEFGFN
ncbi:MAG: endonuclease/exonuclease/phosphatase family protein [Lentisphaeraceae bacterium]|nr:endonuclease/exonuclease/phosphatase family protein [Lentisphaeraceae bacterium]